MGVSVSPDDSIAEGVPSAAPRTAAVGECPLCGGLNATPLFQTHDRLHSTPGMFIYRRCCGCKTVFQDPRVIADDIELCYPIDYHTHAPPLSADPSASDSTAARPLSSARDLLRASVAGAVRGKRASSVLGWLGRWLAMNRRVRERAFYDAVVDEVIPRAEDPGRALDIGCGAGGGILRLMQVGWKVDGVEWDPTAVEVARRVTSCSIRSGDFRKISLPVATYDLVMMHHVLEHLDDPIGGLRRAAELLAPGGRLVVVYPNPDSLGARVFGKDWFHWDAPRHLVLPSVSALAREAGRIGIMPVSVRTTARWVCMFPKSSGYRNGDSARSQLSNRDRFARLLERMLVSLGCAAGEEAVISFKRQAKSG
jgi:SAM-dependent methyltransferase